MTKNITRDVERLLEKEPRGLLITEIACRLGVHRHTSRKYVEVLASEGRIIIRRVGKAAVCYQKCKRLAHLLVILFPCFVFINTAGMSRALSDCTGTDVAPCHLCDVYAINISLYYPNGTLAAYTLNSTPVSAGTCTCTCYTENCCATDTYKNYSAAWNVGYTVCPAEGLYNAQMSANATQTATEWEGPSANFTVYTVNWDADQNWCQCKVGSGRWSIGGEVAATSCCGDDSSEYKMTETQGTDAPAQFDDGTDACCNANTDCVEADTCYSTAATYGAIPNKGYCSSGSWYGGDYSSAACSAVVGSGYWNLGGEVSATACCGDDSSEYKMTRLCDGLACTSDSTDDGCCNANTDCIWSSGCYAAGESHPTLGGVTCVQGTWTDSRPQWRNQGTNDTDNIVSVGGAVNLTAEGFDGRGLDYAWLETNESGSWRNYTAGNGGVYGSPKDMGDATAWMWSNFTWSNASVASGKNVAWRIWYNDTSNQLNSTSMMVFFVEYLPVLQDVSIVTAAPTEVSDIELYVTCTDSDAGSLTAYWRWWRNGVLQAEEGGSTSVTNGASTLLDTISHLITSEGENWTAEAWCGDGYVNTTTANASVIIQAGPEYSFQITLTINGTQNDVYVPGTGAFAAGSLGSITSSPGDYYLASYRNGILYGLVHFYQMPYSLTVSNTSGNHSLLVNSSIRNSNVFLVFSKGDWKNIQALMALIEAGTFLMKPLPSFAYGLGRVSTVFVMLAYSSLDLFETGVYHAGDSRIYIQKVNETGGVPVVNVTR